MNAQKKQYLRWTFAGLLATSLPQIAHANEVRTQQLSLQDALDLALARSPQRKASLLLASQARAELQAKQARFDESVFSSFRYEKGATSTQGTQNLLATGFSRGRFEIGATKPTSIGGSVELSLGMVRSRNAIALPSPTGPSEVEVQEYFVQPRFIFRQPILQNAGVKVSRAPIKKAKAQLNRAKAKKDQQTIELTREVTLAYWDLKAAQIGVRACKKAKALVQQQIATTSVLIQEGRRAQRDQLALKQELSVKEIELQAALTQQSNRGTNLQLLMGLPVDARHQTWWRASAPMPEPQSANRKDIGNRILKGHPELSALAATVDSLRQDLLVARNRRKPVLDAYLSAATRGLSRDALKDANMRSQGSWSKALGSFFDDASPPRLVDYSLEAGLELRWSPRNREARALANKAQLELDAATLHMLRTRQRLLAEITKAQSAQESLHNQWSLAKNSVELAEQNLEVERDRFEAGFATNDDLLLRINELYQAQRRLGQIQIDWIKSKVQYAAVTGTLGYQKRL